MDFKREVFSEINLGEYNSYVGSCVMEVWRGREGNAGKGRREKAQKKTRCKGEKTKSEMLERKSLEPSGRCEWEQKRLEGRAVAREIGTARGEKPRGGLRSEE